MKSSNVLRTIMISPLVGLIHVYRYAISPLLPAACRHAPTCSAYTIEALHKFGPFTGGLLAAGRILRCHPWGTSGFDPVPRIIIKKVRLRNYGVCLSYRLPHSSRLKEH
jgi:hypothetical protein